VILKNVGRPSRRIGMRYALASLVCPGAKVSSANLIEAHQNRMGLRLPFAYRSLTIAEICGLPGLRYGAGLAPFYQK
jgi:hypothetical protein